jgi:hypothetical protein
LGSFACSSLPVRLSEPAYFLSKSFRFQPLFTPKSQFWSFQTPKLNSKDVYRSYMFQNTWTYSSFEITTSNHQNSSIHQNFYNFQPQQQFSSPIHQSWYPMHQFINNSCQNNNNNIWTWFRQQFNNNNFIHHQLHTKTHHVHIYPFWHTNSTTTTQLSINSCT